MEPEEKLDFSSDEQNPLPAIITPEWYYSDSIRIIEDIRWNWESLEKMNIIPKIASELRKSRYDEYVDQFENTFSSWYQPYHYKPRDKWGIHLRYDSWIRVATKFHENNPSVKSNDLNSTKAAFLFFFNHQIFHYLTENAASVLEIIAQSPFLYKNYYSNVYAELFNTKQCLEETLANSYLLQYANQCHIDRKYLKKELLRQDNGYRHFTKYQGENFLAGIRYLVSQIRQRLMKPKILEPLEQIMNVHGLQECTNAHGIPIWLHYESKPVNRCDESSSDSWTVQGLAS
jgi:hypothetical protein